MGCEDGAESGAQSIPTASPPSAGHPRPLSHLPCPAGERQELSPRKQRPARPGARAGREMLELGGEGAGESVFLLEK